MTESVQVVVPLFLLTLFMSSLLKLMAESVQIVARSEWKAVDPRDKDLLKSPAERVIIHHTDVKIPKGRTETYRQLQAIQRVHMQERHFVDIGYNFLVGEDGTVYEGRGWGVMGAHCKNHNNDSVGIAFMGNFNNDKPSLEALRAVKALLKDGISKEKLHPEFVLFGHRDLGNTECPGDNLYASLPQLRSAE